MARGQDFAKPTDRRSTGGSSRPSAARSRRKPERSEAALPIWVWTVLAVAILLLIAAVYHVSRPAEPLQFSPSSDGRDSLAEPAQTATAAGAHQAAAETVAQERPASAEKVEIPAREDPTFDFYSMLPSDGVAVPATTESSRIEARPPEPKPSRRAQETFAEPSKPAPTSNPATEAAGLEALADAAERKRAEQQAVADQKTRLAEQKLKAESLAQAAQQSRADQQAKADASIASKQKAAEAASLTAQLRQEEEARKAAKARKAEQAAKAAEQAKAQTAAAAVAAAKAPAAQSSSGRFAVQVAALRSVEDAERIRAQLLMQGFSARIEQAEVKGQTWQRLRLGPFASREAAQASKQALAAAGHQAVLIPLGKP